MAKRHVYHWKHGWIPLTHTAAMSKAKGNREKAAELLRDAHDKGAGIHTREHVGKSALDLTSIADANERAEALVDVQDAADRLGAHDLLPKALQRKSAAGPKPGAPRRTQLADGTHVEIGREAGKGGHDVVAIRKLTQNPLTGEVSTAGVAAAMYPDHVTPDMLRGLGVRDADIPHAMSLAGKGDAPKALPVKLKGGKSGTATPRQGGGVDVRDENGSLVASVSEHNASTLESLVDSQTLADIHKHAGFKAPSRVSRAAADKPEADRFRMQKAAPKSREAALPGTDANPHVKTSISASEAKVGDSINLPSGGRMSIAKIEPAPGGMLKITDTNGRSVKVSPRQAMSRLDGPLDAPKADAPKATPKAAPKSRAKGIVLNGRTEDDRYHYRKTDGTLEPQNDRVVNRLKRLEASARKADREGDVFGAHQARQEFARITGEHESVITYLPGSNARGADAGLPDGYKVKRDVIDGYGPVNTYSVHDASGKRVGTGYNSPESASRAAHKHSTRAQQAEADRVALQQRLKAEREQREAAHAKVVADGRAKYAQPDTVDVADQVATNHLVERMSNAPGAMQPGELAKIAGSSHVAQHHRDRAQTELNAQALKRVQFMDGANDERALNARLVDARHMPDGPMKVALIDALERQLAAVRRR